MHGRLLLQLSGETINEEKSSSWWKRKNTLLMHSDRLSSLFLHDDEVAYACNFYTKASFVLPMFGCTPLQLAYW